jgi:hypothetical protein
VLAGFCPIGEDGANCGDLLIVNPDVVAGFGHELLQCHAFLLIMAPDYQLPCRCHLAAQPIVEGNLLDLESMEDFADLRLVVDRQDEASLKAR